MVVGVFLGVLHWLFWAVLFYDWLIGVLFTCYVDSKESKGPTAPEEPGPCGLREVQRNVYNTTHHASSTHRTTQLHARLPPANPSCISVQYWDATR